MNRIDRLVALTLYLQGRHVSKAEDMAAHFEVSLRTIYRDIAALGEAGVPIIAEAGVGYSLMRGYHLPPVTFTAEEAAALVTAGVLTRQMTDASLHESMQSALLKIRAVLPPDQQERFERLESSIALSEGQTQDYAASLLSLQQALANRQVVHLAYRTGGHEAVTEREVEPVGLTHYLAHWHLVAWCRLRNDVRDFRLDRIAMAKTQPEHYEPREGVTLEAVIEQDRQCETAIAVVHFARHVVDRAKREWALGIVDEDEDTSGSTLTLSAVSLDWFVGWLLSFQTAATIRSPKVLQTKVRNAAITIAETLHKPAPPTRS